MLESDREALAEKIEEAIRRARHETSRANYPGALAELESALKLSPQDPLLRDMLQQTTKAALRHEAAVERNRAVAQTAEGIGDLLDAGELDEAAAELREASLRFGNHKALQALRERLDERSREAELERTVAVVDQARAHLDAGKWQAAVRHAERVLRADPRNEEALEVRRLARAEIERQEARRQADLEIGQAVHDIERLIRAEEPERASRTLRQAVDRLGRHEEFDELARRLDQAKAELQAKKRLDWTQRRLKEAEDLVRQAGRSTLQGKHGEAIERLRRARELHPEHPEIEDMIEAARTAHERAQAERRRAESMEAAKAEIRQLLDALRLDAAAARLKAARARFGQADAGLRSLATRLERLAAGTADAPSLDAAEPETEFEALERQRDLAAAYSWKQTALFAFRAEGLRAFWGLFVLAVGLEALAAVPRLAAVCRPLRLLVPCLALAWVPVIVRESARGRNTLPPWNDLFDLRRRLADLALVAGILIVAGLPLAALVLARGWHGLFAAGTGWWLAAFAGWLAAVTAVAASLAAGAFGATRALRLGGHVRALAASGGETLVTADLVFATVLALVILRATFLPYIPWMGSPLAAGIEAWALITVPHLVGVVARRHHLELARLYRA